MNTQQQTFSNPREAGAQKWHWFETIYQVDPVGKAGKITITTWIIYLVAFI